MIVINKVKKIRDAARSEINNTNTIGLIPTMGALHAGHFSLIQKAKEENDVVIVSVFVNPTQFDDEQDLKRYPRSIEQDKRLIGEHANILFIPTTEEMYPEGFDTSVHVGDMARILEGKYRPGHFDGVATVVLKLLNICQPTRIYFGQKDYQQTLVVKQMVRDLNVPAVVRVLPTVREESGLARSSRNKHLSTKQKESAATIYQILQKARKMIEGGERNGGKVESFIQKELEKIPESKLDYAVVRALDLSEVGIIDQDVVLLVALYVGDVRLIDNVIVKYSSS